ncbi:hypothetical protein AVEN_231026-1 [Araneus ventricosus]|uniref:Uncharacterized protein n=1 Tax=Araneus ventricosus TaxID=182803 RepID=A0A4Y2A435_ARAVE|nr:hypothetical protein AVEN_231026-1 [Araneus ventricosus]
MPLPSPGPGSALDMWAKENLMVCGAARGIRWRECEFLLGFLVELIAEYCNPFVFNLSTSFAFTVDRRMEFLAHPRSVSSLTAFFLLSFASSAKNNSAEEIFTSVTMWLICSTSRLIRCGL